MIHGPDIQNSKSTFGMLVKYSVESSEDFNISHSVTLVPRLGYSMNLLSEIIETLSEKKIRTQRIKQRPCNLL